MAEKVSKTKFLIFELGMLIIMLQCKSKDGILMLYFVNRIFKFLVKCIIVFW